MSIPREVLAKRRALAIPRAGAHEKGTLSEFEVGFQLSDSLFRVPLNDRFRDRLMLPPIRNHPIVTLPKDEPDHPGNLLRETQHRILNLLIPEEFAKQHVELAIEANTRRQIILLRCAFLRP